MKLLDYLKSLPVNEREPFAKRCGSSIGHLNNVAYGCRPCNEQLAVEIEKRSARKVTCEELCPDTDWAFIRGTATRGSKSRSAA
jgi:DNA-binding transcriptional regulator YdaS (Cro superfamily)